MTQVQIEDSIRQIKSDITTINNTLSVQAKNISDKVTRSDLVKSEQSMQQNITDLTTIVTTIEQQLSLITIPSDTRYYLSQSEVSTFRSNLNQLLAMMTQFQELYKNLVAYSATVTTPFAS